MLFLFPEKPNEIHDLNIVPPNYLGQIKKDGHRAIIEIDNIVKIYNRQGGILSATANQNWSFLNKIFPNKSLLDGEIVGIRQAKEKSDTIVIWDIPICDNIYLLKNSYLERWNLLNSFVAKNQIVTNKSFGCKFIGENNGLSIYLSNNFQVSEAEDIFKQLDGNFDEGIVFKNPNSCLEWSKTKTKVTINQLKYKIKK